NDPRAPALPKLATAVAHAALAVAPHHATLLLMNFSSLLVEDFRLEASLVRSGDAPGQLGRKVDVVFEARELEVAARLVEVRRRMPEFDVVPGVSTLVERCLS